MQAGTDPRAARPIGHLLGTFFQSLIRIAAFERARDIGQPGAKSKRIHALTLVGKRMEKMQK